MNRKLGKTLVFFFFKTLVLIVKLHLLFAWILTWLVSLPEYGNREKQRCVPIPSVQYEKGNNYFSYHYSFIFLTINSFIYF